MILYACPIWCDVLNFSTKRQKLLSIQRAFIIGMIRAFRTVSLEASLVIAKCPPIDLKLRFYSNIFSIKHNNSFSDYQLPLNFADTIHPAKINISIACNDFDDVCDFAHDYVIFTDGSKIDGQVGASFVVSTLKN